jgi:hypothetical protein
VIGLIAYLLNRESNLTLLTTNSLKEWSSMQVDKPTTYEVQDAQAGVDQKFDLTSIKAGFIYKQLDYKVSAVSITMILIELNRDLECD